MYYIGLKFFLYLHLAFSKIHLPEDSSTSLKAMVSDIIRATFPQPCLCIKLLLKGDSLAESVIASGINKAFHCPLTTINSEEANEVVNITDIICHGNVMATKDYLENVFQQLKKTLSSFQPYSKVLIFFQNYQWVPTDSINDEEPLELSVLCVVKFLNQSSNHYSALNYEEHELLANWNNETGLVTHVRGSLMDAVKTSLVVRAIRFYGFRLSVFNCPPFVTYNDVHGKNNSIYDGIEIRIIRALCHSWPITFLEKNSKWGSWTKVVDDLIKRRSDAALCSLWVNFYQTDNLGMSTPWKQMSFSFLVPKPHLITSEHYLYRSLQPETWLVVFVSIVLTNAVLWIFARIVPSGPIRSRVEDNLLDTYRLLLSSCIPTYPENISIRSIIVSWAFFGLLITTAFSTGYTSLLASPPYSKPIETVADFLDYNLQWGEPNSGIELFFLNSEDDNIINLGRRFVLENDLRKRDTLVKGGNYAIFVKKIKHFVPEVEHLSEEALDSLQMMKQDMINFYVGVGLQKDSPYKTLLDKTIFRLNEGGLIDFWEQDIIRRLGYRYMNKFFEPLVVQPDAKPFRLDSLFGAFSVLAVGLLVAFALFVVELNIHRLY